MRTDLDPSTRSDQADEPVTLSRGQLDDLLARLDRLEGERAAPAATSRAAPPPAGPRLVGRRRALAGLAGAAAAGTVVALGSASPAAAADGDPVLLGQANTATSPTGIRAVGGPRDYVLGVLDGTPVGDLPTSLTILGHAKGDASFTGIQGVAEGPGVVAVAGRSDEGVAGEFITEATDAPALFAGNAQGIGLVVGGTAGQIAFTPEYPSPQEFTTTGRTGTLYMQCEQGEEGALIDGTLWLCVDEGMPGTWRKLAGHDTAGTLHLLPAPRRVYDSRPGTNPPQLPKTPLPTGGAARTIDLMHNASTVPAGATGALVTVLLTNATSGSGNFTIWANDQPKPAANTMVWGGSAGRFTTLALTAVDPQARVKVSASLQTHVILDVVGYYR